MFNHTLFNLVITIGLVYGQLPFLLSQVIIFINMTANNYIYGLYLFFLTIKALVISKRSWLLEVSDAKIVWFSRLVAVIVVSIRTIGDYLLLDLKPAPGILTKLLTSTDQQT